MDFGNRSWRLSLYLIGRSGKTTATSLFVHCNYTFTFYYQLPGLIHTKDKGCSRWGQFVMCNVGFLVAFTALLLLAMFEEELNAIIDL